MDEKRQNETRAKALAEYIANAPPVSPKEPWEMQFLENYLGRQEKCGGDK